MKQLDAGEFRMAQLVGAFVDSQFRDHQVEELAFEAFGPSLFGVKVVIFDTADPDVPPRTIELRVGVEHPEFVEHDCDHFGVEPNGGPNGSLQFVPEPLLSR